MPTHRIHRTVRMRTPRTPAWTPRLFVPGLCLLLVAVLPSVLLSVPARADQPIRFAPLPMESPEVIVKAFNPLVAYLQARLGQPVEMVYFDTHREILAAFEQDELDVIFLGPLPYVSLRQGMAEVAPLVFFKESNGEARYRCALISFVGDDLALAEMRGRPFGLTQPLSTCGYLGADAMLREHAGLCLEDLAYRYLGTHEAVVFAVTRGEAQAGSVKDEFAHKYAPLGITIHAYSGWVPATGLFANTRTLDAELVRRIREVLLAAPESEYRLWGETIRHGMVPASDEAFAAFREFGDPADIP
jgi:phosphonate transport system substrate-binding protein